jgi:hypothetical protein
VPIKATGPIVIHRPEKSPFDIVPMSCQCQIIFNHPLGSYINRNEADLGPLALDTKMHDTLSAVQVLYPQTAEFFAPDTVIQQGSQDGPIPDALERVRARVEFRQGGLRQIKFFEGREVRDQGVAIAEVANDHTGPFLWQRGG